MIQCDGCSEWYHEEWERSIPQKTLHGSQKTCMLGIAEIAMQHNPEAGVLRSAVENTAIKP